MGSLQVLEASAEPLDAAFAATKVVSTFAPVVFPKTGDDYLGFRLLEELGRGSFGRVYLAEQYALGGRLVALKLATDLAQDCATLPQLRHTNVVPIHSVHEANGLWAICMPYLGPCTLADVLRKAHANGLTPHSGAELLSSWKQARTTLRNEAPSTVLARPAAPDNARRATFAPAAEPSGEQAPSTLEALSDLPYPLAICRLGAALAEGLAHAHARGILHRDIKPANILITDDGEPVLVDFSLAEDIKPSSAGLFRLGGTLPYMAPEQLREGADGPATVDRRSDLYALGVVLFEALTGHHPFQRGGQGRPRLSLLAPSARTLNADVPERVDTVVRRCLARNPADRYATADQVAADLRCCLEGQPLRHTDDPAAFSRLNRWCARHWAALSIAGVASATAAALFVGATVASTGAAGAAAAEHAALAPKLEANWVELQGDVALLEDFGPAAAEAEKLLAPFGVEGDQDWTAAPTLANLPPEKRAGLKRRIAGALLLLAETELTRGLATPAQAAERTAAAAARIDRAALAWPAAAPPRAVVWMRARVAKAAGAANAAELRQAALALPAGDAEDAQLFAAVAAGAREFSVARAALDEANLRAFDATFLRGLCALAGRDLPAAADLFEQCSIARPGNCYLHLLQGSLHERSQDHDLVGAALHHYSVAAHLRKDLPAPWVGRAEVLYRLQAFNAAERDLETARTIGGEGPRYWLIKSLLLNGLGELEESAAARRQAQSSKPKTTRDLEALPVVGKTVEPSANPLPWSHRDDAAQAMWSAATDTELLAALPQLRRDIELAPELRLLRRCLAQAEAVAGNRAVAFAVLAETAGGKNASKSADAWARAAVLGRSSARCPQDLAAVKAQLARVSGENRFAEIVGTHAAFAALRASPGFAAWLTETTQKASAENGLEEKRTAADS